MTHDELDEALTDIRAIEKQLARQRLQRDRELAERPTLLVHELDALFSPGCMVTVTSRKA